jgi:hypothetical protein
MGNLASKRQRTAPINAGQAKQITIEASRRLQANRDAYEATATERHQKAIMLAKEKAALIVVKILRNIKTEASRGEYSCLYCAYADENWNNADEREYIYNELVRAIKALGFDVIAVIDRNIIKLRIEWR